MMQLVSRLKEWVLQSSEQRRAERHPGPGTVAYYWDGSVPVPREIRNISLTGAYLITPERWYPGTIIKLTMNPNCPGPDGSKECIEIRCRVVRHGTDGVGLKFISQEVNERKGLNRFLQNVIANRRKNKNRHLASDGKGQALVEFALLLPAAVADLQRGEHGNVPLCVHHRERRGSDWSSVRSHGCRFGGLADRSQLFRRFDLSQGGHIFKRLCVRKL
jgi:hypothetical protein